MPFAYTSKPTTAKAGEFVLVPSKTWIDDAFIKGGDTQTFIYYAATMVEPGPLESKIKTLPGETVAVPNGFVVPIRAGEKAKPGELVLTWWQSGSGMERSIVVAGGSETAPKALHLDLSVDTASSPGMKEDTLKAGSFHKLGQGLEPGISLACKESSGHSHWITTGVEGETILAIGFAGKMRTFAKTACTVVPPNGKHAVGSAVAVPNLGMYAKGTVDKVDAAKGRAYVKINSAGTEKVVAAALPDVSSVLAGM